MSSSPSPSQAHVTVSPLNRAAGDAGALSNSKSKYSSSNSGNQNIDKDCLLVNPAVRSAISVAERRQAFEEGLVKSRAVGQERRASEVTTGLSRSSAYNGKRGNVACVAPRIAVHRCPDTSPATSAPNISVEISGVSCKSLGASRGPYPAGFVGVQPSARLPFALSPNSLSSLSPVTNTVSSSHAGALQKTSIPDSLNSKDSCPVDVRPLQPKVLIHPGSAIQTPLPTVRIVPPENQSPQFSQGNLRGKKSVEADITTQPKQLPGSVADNIITPTSGQPTPETVDQVLIQEASSRNHTTQSLEQSGSSEEQVKLQYQDLPEPDEPPPPINPKSPARALQRQDLSGIIRFLLPRFSAPDSFQRPLSFVSASLREPSTTPKLPRGPNLPTLRNPSFKHQVASARIVTQSTFQPAQACSVDLVNEGPATHSEEKDHPVIFPDHFQRQALFAKFKSQAEKESKMEGDGEGNVAMPRLEDLLRYPEDLDKISTLKAEYSRKKAAVDSQLREGLRDQLETVQRCMNQLGEGQRHVMKTRDELHDIDKLCAESQNTVGDFSQIDKLARIQRNFDATIIMKERLESFETDLADIEKLLKEDDEDLENQPNLLPAHMAITKLRDFRDEAMDQIRKAQDSSAETTLTELFSKLDGVIDWFDEHLGTACMSLIPLVQSDNRSMVVRLAVVIMNEEKKDSRVLALQEAQKDHKDLASRFKSMNIGPKTVHGYKDKFLEAIRLYAQAQFDQSKEQFLDDPDRLEKSFRWFFNDLFTVKEGLQSLMPKKWKIYQTYTNTYHKMMHDFLMEFVNDPELPASNMLAIIHWTSKYYKKMAKLGWQASDLQPNVLDDREGELVRDWRNLIVKSLDEWMDRFNTSDRKRFLERDADSLDSNADGLFCTKTHGDMWRMIYEQIQAAAASQRTDVMEGVIEAMFRSLKTRQMNWQNSIDDEVARYKNISSTDQSEGIQAFQDWLIAVANDQIAVIDDGEIPAGATVKDVSVQQLGYLTRFRRDFEPHVSPKFLGARADVELDNLRDGYVDLATHCLSAFNDLIFTVDFATTLPDFFTPK
ncbi:SNARE-binding exocyst subunit S6, partial [Ascosphaera aggregata]